MNGQRTYIKRWNLNCFDLFAVPKIILQISTSHTRARILLALIYDRMLNHNICFLWRNIKLNDVSHSIERPSVLCQPALKCGRRRPIRCPCRLRWPIALRLGHPIRVETLMLYQITEYYIHYIKHGVYCVCAVCLLNNNNNNKPQQCDLVQCE